jgi:hypothetical protein
MSTGEGRDEMGPVVVVGYDGTEPALRALHSGADMVRNGKGRLEVVFVAHMPSTVSFSGQGVAAVRDGLDAEERDLAAQVDAVLRPSEVKWNFQRRNGEIARELLAAGQEVLDAEGPTTRVVLIVGGSAHKIDRYLNSTPAKVIRQDRFEVVVIP